MRKPDLFLRLAAILTFIHAVLHTIGGVFGKPGPGPATTAVDAMKVNSFLFMGATRTYWDFNRGLGLAVAIFLVAEAIVFWQLASIARSDARRLRPVLITFAIAYVALAANSYFYFFIAPVIVELVIAGFLVLAIISANSQPKLRPGASTGD